MYKYKGVLVHQTQDEQGIIEIIDNKDIRSLHFGTESRQSSISIKDPDKLHSLYARTMMALLLFNDSPENVLMIGLGGGTITKYLLNQFSDCQFKVIEYRAAVLKIARSHFGLPLNPRLKVQIGCGGDYVSKNSKIQEEQHDLIVVDAFSESGMVTEVSNENFFDGCRTLLKTDGILAINLWGSDKALFQQVAWNMGRVFDWKILFLPVRKRGNIIGFAFRENATQYSMSELKAKALELEKKYQLEFPVYVKDLKRNNPSVLKKVLRNY